MQLKTSPLHGVLHGTPLRYIFWGLDFYTGSDPKNMTTIVVITTPNEDKKLPKIVSIENPWKAHSSFWSREFSGIKDLFVVGSDMKRPKASTKTMKVREMKSLW